MCIGCKRLWLSSGPFSETGLEGGGGPRPGPLPSPELSGEARAARPTPGALAPGVGDESRIHMCDSGSERPGPEPWDPRARPLPWRLPTGLSQMASEAPSPQQSSPRASVPRCALRGDSV